MEQEMKMSGPYRFEIKVAFAHGDGDSAEVTIDCGNPGTIPSAERVAEILQEAVDHVAGMVDGARLMTKPEYFNFLMAEKTGVETEWATPGGEEWEPSDAR